MKSGTQPPALYDTVLGHVLKQRRKDASMTKTALASAAGVHLHQIKRYEVGTNKVSVSRLIQLAQAMGVSASEIVAEVEELVEQNGVANTTERPGSARH